MSGMIMEINEPKDEKLITDERRNHYYMKSIILMQELMYKKIYSLLLPTESIYQNMKFIIINLMILFSAEDIKVSNLFLDFLEGSMEKN